MLVLFYENNTVLFNIKRMVLVSLLWIAAYFDFKSYRIPNKLILLGLALRTVILMFELVFEREEILYICVSELIAAAILLVMSFVAMFVVKNGLGMGDAKLFAVMGLYLGIQGSLSAVFYVTYSDILYFRYLNDKEKEKAQGQSPICTCNSCRNDGGRFNIWSIRGGYLDEKNKKNVGTAVTNTLNCFFFVLVDIRRCSKK